jgi:transcriptional regulator with XRE-family HTH domain
VRLAGNVRRIRVERGIPQEQLAYDAGLDRSHVAGIEQQKENPTIDLLERIAATLAVHLSKLFVQPLEDATPPNTLRKGRKPTRPCRKKQ